jgi:hypothetical protein
MAKHEEREAKAMWMILDLVKDHLIPHLSKKKVMFSTLTNMFHSNNENRKDGIEGPTEEHQDVQD